ncbi:MAG: polysaccharide deacetylase family protein [Nitrospirota bacterium]
MKNALTVDLEDWYHICGVEELSDASEWHTYESRIIKSTAKVLNMLRDYNVKATFFVLGYIAAKEPGLIREIKDDGHEIASHGYFHRRIFELTKEEFEDDIVRSIDVISSITNKKVSGFRAPEWSIRPNTFWALESLRKNGILYDSSMVPLTRMGDRGFPVNPSPIKTKYGDILEFPLTTARLFWENIPFSGGLPLRMVPYFYILSKIKRMNREGKSGMVYIHPWEFDRQKQKIDLPLSRRFMHYFNIRVTPKKVRGLLEHLPFAPVKEVLSL